MSDDTDDNYLNYVHQLRNTLEVLKAEPEHQCDVMGAYNAPWELKTDASDFIDSVFSLERGRLDAETMTKLVEFKKLLQELPNEAVTPTGQAMTTFQGCLVALKHPAWIRIRSSASELMSMISDPFPGP